MTKLSERMKDRLVALMEAGQLESATERLPLLLEHGRFALEELKEVIQLEAELDAWIEKGALFVEQGAEVERLREAAEEVIHEVSPMNSDAATALTSLREALEGGDDDTV